MHILHKYVLPYTFFKHSAFNTNICILNLWIWLQIATHEAIGPATLVIPHAEHSPTVLRTVCTHASLRYGSGFDEGDEDEDLWFDEGPCDTKKGSF